MNERDVFLDLLEIPDEGVRSARLDAVCAGDLGLRRRVESLLRSLSAAGDFLARPAVASSESGSPARTEPMEGVDLDRKKEEDGLDTLTFLLPPERSGSLGRLGHYEVMDVLGRGGCGVVLRAFDDVLHRVVAVKTLAPQLATTATARRRFLREARSSAAIRHENVVQVHAVEENPVPFLVMECVPGETLQKRLDRVGPLPVADVVEIGRQIASGLAAAHARGLIHRDVKPANILIEPGPRPRAKLTDFGLARAVDDLSLSRTGSLAGTPMYMSPEQAQGETLDHRSDLFSLGAVLYAMCAGHPPFRASGTLAVLKRVVDDDPPPLREAARDVPAWLADLVARLLAKRPADRIATAAEVEELFARRAGALRTKRTSLPSPAALPVRRWAVACLIVLCLAGLGFGGGRRIAEVGGLVVRFFSPSGTLVVEVDDPGVSVSIDGNELVITGAGAREIRLDAGRHIVKAEKDGLLLKEELVEVAANGRRIVRVSREGGARAPSPSPSPSPTIPPEPKVVVSGGAEADRLVARLKALNPAFEGTVKLESPRVLFINGRGVTDVSPVLDLPSLRSLECSLNGLSDISPLRRLKLTYLSVRGSDVRDLSPVAGMALTGLECTGAPVSDLSLVKGMPIEDLQMAYTEVADISFLKGMEIEVLNLEGCAAIEDFSPLAEIRVDDLILSRTRIRSLDVLKGKRLRKLFLEGVRADGLDVLKGMPLEEIRLDYRPERHAELLRSIPTLKIVNRKPIEEFWKENPSR